MWPNPKQKGGKFKMRKKISLILIPIIILSIAILELSSEWIKCKDNFSRCTEGGCESPTRAEDCMLYNCIDGEDVHCKLPGN